MTDYIREGVLRLRTEVVDQKLDGPDLSAFFKQQEAANTATRESLDLLLKQGEQAGRAGEAEAEAQEAVRRETEQTNRRREEAVQQQTALADGAVRIGESLRKTGDGAFAFARGLALTSLEGNEGMQEVIETVAKLQGQFDLFRGGVDVLGGLSETASFLADELDESAKSAGGLTGALAGVVGFLGPAGTIAVGAGAAAAAIGLIFVAFADDAEDEIDRAEKRLLEFTDRARREAAQLEIELAASSARRQEQDAAEREAAIQRDLENVRGGLSGLTGEDVESSAASIDARDQLAVRVDSLNNALRNLAANAGPGAAPSQATIDQAKRLREERDEAAAQLGRAGGALDGTERESLLAQAEAELGRRRSERDLGQELRREFESGSRAADQAREREIEASAREQQRLDAERSRAQERLRREEQQAKEDAEEAARELTRLTPSQLQFVQGNLGNVGALNAQQREELKRIAPKTAGDAIRNAERQDANLAPIDPNAEINALRSEIAKLTSAISQQQANTANLRGADQQADASDAAQLQALRNQNIATIDVVEGLESRITTLQQQLETAGVSQ